MHEFIKQKLLIIAPHPDDETIGCAGLIQKVKEQGGSVFVLFLTNGDTNDFSKDGFSSEEEREEEIESVVKYLKFDDYHIAFPGNDFHLKLDTLGQKTLMNMIERESRVSVEKIKPDIVAFPTFDSYNQDHRAAAYASFGVLRPSSPFKHAIKYVLSYEEAADQWRMEEKPVPNFFVPLTEKEMEVKHNALKLFKSQYREVPSNRSWEALRSLAVLRGSMCGQNYAEAFYIHRLTI